MGPRKAMMIKHKKKVKTTHNKDKVKLYIEAKYHISNTSIENQTNK